MNEDLKQPGALLDERPKEEKEKDFKFEEIVASAAPVNWVEKMPSEWRKFPVFDQNGSGSCVAQTMRKILGVYIQQKTGVFIKLSASHIYQRRANRPQAGMSGHDVFKIAQKGTTLEDLAVSEKMSDAAMDAVSVNEFERSIGEAFRIGNYLEITDRTIDTIASIIQETKKSVMVWFYFDNREWTNVPELKFSPDLYAASTARHSVSAVDFTLYNGKKALIVDESWGLGFAFNGQRVITEDFFKARCFFAAHFMNFAFEDQTQPSPVPPPAPNTPLHTFLFDLEFSPIVSYSEEVKALQRVLKYEGLFPVNVEATGYYGSLTRTAVGKFQEKHLGMKPGDAGYGRCGPRTRAKLNQLYGN